MAFKRSGVRSPSGPQYAPDIVIGSVLSCGSNSVVEFHVANVAVAGSNPVSRSKIVRRLRPVAVLLRLRQYHLTSGLFRSAAP